MKKLPNNLMYKYKNEGRSLKDFRNYLNLTDLFINLKDGNVKPREVLKNQIDFKSDLGEIKKGNPKSKSEDQISVIQNVQFTFYLRGKFINFFRDFSILISEAKCKAKHGKRSQNINSNSQRLPIALAQVKAGTYAYRNIMKII